MNQVFSGITESDQKGLFIFSLKDAQKIQVQGRLRDTIVFSVEKRGPVPCLWGPGESRNLESLPSVNQAPRLWRSDEGWGAISDGSVPFIQYRKWGALPILFPFSVLFLVAPSPPDVQSCGWVWLPPSL